MFTPIAILSLFSLALASDVLVLTDKDFEGKAKQYDIMLIEFYAPWCGHCKKLAPEYEKAATTLKANDPPVTLAKVDCTVETTVCGKYGVSGYPTLKIFKGGELSSDYEGPREAGGIVKTMKGKAGPVSKDLVSVEVAEKFFKNPEYVVVGFFGKDKDLPDVFQKVANALSDELTFAHTSEAAVLEKYGHSDVVVLYQPTKLHSKFEEPKQVFDGEATVSKIKDWIKEQSLGLCPVRTMDNMGKFTNPLVVAYFDVDYVKNPKGTNYWRNRVMKVGKKVKEAGRVVSFAISSGSDMQHELSEFGVTSPPTDKPAVAGRNGQGQKFVMTDEFSMDNLEKFVNDLLDDKLEAYMKSEPVPDNSGNDVKVVVGRNFEEVVNDDSKDVLIEFYAPWCGHCKSLEPKYKELAEKLKDESEITIAKMDATANDVPPQYQVQGFPTIYFAPQGSKKSPMKYEGGREVKDFVKYLASKSTNEMAGFGRDGKKKKSKEEL